MRRLPESGGTWRACSHPGVLQARDGRPVRASAGSPRCDEAPAARATRASRGAEREGFEPSVRLATYAGLANRWFQPLTHLSGGFSDAYGTVLLPNAVVKTESYAARSFRSMKTQSVPRPLDRRLHRREQHHGVLHHSCGAYPEHPILGIVHEEDHLSPALRHHPREHLAGETPEVLSRRIARSEH